MKIKQLIILSLDIIFIIAIIYFLMNYKLYIVSSGSMEPYLKTNELILVKRHLNSYSVGDIICYNDESMKFPITHRIINIEKDNYYTKGDYNNIADFYPTNIDNIIGKVIWHSYYFGMLYKDFRFQLLFLLILMFIIINVFNSKTKFFHILQFREGKI